MPLSQSDAPATKKIVMPHRRDHIIKQARERIARIRASLDAMDYLCSGTLLRRMKMCGKPGCRWHRGPRRTSRPVLRMGTHERGQARASHGNARASRSPAPGYRQLLQGQEAHEGLGARDRTARRQRGTPRALTRLNKGAAKIIQKLHLRHAESKSYRPNADLSFPVSQSPTAARAGHLSRGPSATPLPPIQARRCRRRLPTAQRGLVKRSYVKMGDDWVPLHGMR